MRILHVLSHVGWSGGIESYVLNLVGLSQHSDHDMAIVCGSRTAMDVSNVIEEPSLFAPDCGNFDALLETSPDVVHCHSVLNTKMLDWLLDRVPTVITTHGYQLVCPAEDFYQEYGRRICERSCGPGCLPATVLNKCMSLRPRAAIRQYKRAQWGIKNLNRFSAVISPCTDAANRFLSAGLLAKTSHVLPYFCPTPLLEQPRLAPKNLQLTFLGRIRDYKGYDFFVDAVSRIPNVKGVLVGDFNPKSTDLVEALARRVGCLDRIECRAWCSRGELTQLMAETTVFVFPSIWPETLGIVGLEAMANGVPVVAFDVAGVREWLVPGKTGAMVPVKDTAAMVSAIASILADEELAARMGEAAIDRIRAKFLPSDHFDSLVQIYQTAKTGNS